MYAVISCESTHLPAGTVVRMPGTWSDYRALCDSRREDSIPRIKFRDGEILLMSPLPRHGREANIVADVVKILLDRENRNYEAFTPITMDLPEEGGIEPDYCFYIDRWQAAAGKDRIDWQKEPPPDLAIEIDVTSFTAVEDYLPYKVPEVWLLKRSGLNIYRLQSAAYMLTPVSQLFPAVNLADLVERTIQTAAELGSGAALRELRQSLVA